MKARRLTDEEAAEMRGLRAAGVPPLYLAELFGVTNSAVHAVIKGYSHKRAKGPLTGTLVTRPEEVPEIRGLRAAGMSYKSIAALTGKTEVALRRICTGKSFPDAGGPVTVTRHKKGTG